jgi:uncharacterized RmlC-like cupin family protein
LKKTRIKDCRIIHLPKFQERAKGNLSFVENLKQIPFSVKRVFYLFDIPGGDSRGAHAHIACNQFLVAVSGSFAVEVNDGNKKTRHYLNRPDMGLYIPFGIWASEVNFSSGSICLVLASDKFSEDDYIRDYKIFKTLKSDVSSS